MSGASNNGETPVAARAPGIDARFWAALLSCALAGLGGLRLLAPGRGDLLLGASIGAAFGSALTLAGFEITRRRFVRAPLSGIQASLAVTTVKVLAFAAFLLTIALATTLNLPALATGLVGTTLLGEVLAIEAILRLQKPAGAKGMAGGGSAAGDGIEGTGPARR